MDEFVISLSGQLDVQTTVKNILNQMDELSKALNEANNGAKRIGFVGRLNETKTQEAIQAQLEVISENLKLEIKSDGLESVIQSLKELGQSLSHIGGGTGISQNIQGQVEAVDNLGGAFGRATKTMETYSGEYEKLLSHQKEFKRNGVTETLTYDVDEDGNIGEVTSTKVVQNTEAIAKAQERARQTAERYAQEFQNIRDKYEGIGAAKPITRDDHLSELATAADKVDIALKNLQNASNDTFDQLNNDYKVAKNAYEGMAKSFANMENMEMKLKAKPVSVIEQEQISELQKFELQLQQAGISYDSLITKADGSQQTIRDGLSALKQQLADASGNQQALLDYSYAFKEVKDQIELFKSQKGFFDNINSEMEKAGQSITDLQAKISGSKFVNSPEIEQFSADLEALQKRYQEFVNSIANSDPQALSGMAAEVKERSDAIVKEIGDMTNAVNNFHKAANNAAKNDLLQRDKAILSNKIQAWLNENTKASERTRKAMLDLQKQIQSADKAKLTNLSKQFTEIDKQARAAGETGKKFFDVLKQNLSKFTSWYGIGNIVASVTREFRNAINELKEMDTILTEISKTSEKTTSELELLGQQSFDTASQYGRTASDYLSGVLEMSRAGYSNAEAMAELSVKAQSAGDMTAELANQYLIATDAAYGLDGSVEQLSDILDGMNMINNIVHLCRNV